MSKQRTDLFFLAYSPLWMLLIFLVQQGGRIGRWGEAEHMLLGVGLALPIWLWPLLGERDLPLAERHATKAVLFLTALSFVQCYFGSEFFFQALGMEYHFHVGLQLNGTPLFLYPLTVAYFATYFALMRLAVRAFDRRFPRAPHPARVALCALLSYAMAFGETLFMANERLRPYFSYADKHLALCYGSFCYGTLFFVALPLYCRIDRDPERPTPLARVFWDVMGANMLVLVLYQVYQRLL